MVDPDLHLRARGCLLGLACGDAVGTTLEFQPRGTFEPLSDMVFEEAVLRAANLGLDTDTTAAVCGQLAGALYGVEAIPRTWLDRLVMRELIDDWAVRLIVAGTTDEPVGR